MTFVKPILLWGLLAASLPIIIHLINRWRHRTIKWGAMAFLLKATRESRGRKKLRHYLILALRALAIAALVLAIARPRVSSMLGLGGSGVETVILILDRSSSMETRPENANESLRAQVVERVRKTMPEMAGARLILIDSANGRPQEVVSPDVLAEISATAPTDSRADIPGLFQVAVDWLNENNAGKSEIWVASDLQKSDWQPDSGRWESVQSGIKSLTSAPAVRVLGMVDRPQQNHAIRVIEARRRGDELLLTLEITAKGQSQPVSGAIPVTVSLNGAASTESVIMSGASMQFTKRIPLEPDAADGYGYVALSPDANPRDDRAYFVYGQSISSPNIVIAENGESSEALALMASPPGWMQSSLTRLSPSEVSRLDWNKAGLVIWQGELPKGDAATNARKFLENGGMMLFFPDTDVNASKEQFEGLSWGERQTAEKDKFFIPKDWDHKDGVLRDGSDGRPVTVNTLKAILRKELKTDGGAVLATWENGSPAVWRKVVGKGQLVAFGSRPEYSWSNLGDGNILLPVIYRMGGDALKRFEGDRMVSVGDLPGKPLPNETRERLDEAESRPDKANALHTAGVYRMGNRVVAVNRPEGEDEIEVVTDPQMNEIFAGVSFRLFDQKGANTDAMTSEIWRTFLFVMLLAMLVEASLSLPAKYTMKRQSRTLGKLSSDHPARTDASKLPQTTHSQNQA